MWYIGSVTEPTVTYDVVDRKATLLTEGKIISDVKDGRKLTNVQIKLPRRVNVNSCI